MIKEKLEWTWVIGPQFVWVTVSEVGVSGGKWGIILSGWRWMGHYFG